MSYSRINTIAELQAEQDRLQANMALTRNEFYRSATRTTGIGRDFLLKKALLPLAAAGIGAFATRAMLHRRNDSPNPVSKWLSKLLPIVLPIAQQYFAGEKMEEK